VERGTVAIIDALGFRGIWKGRGGQADKERAEKVIASLSARAVRFESEKQRTAATAAPADGSSAGPFAITFLSDTIVIGAAAPPGKDDTFGGSLVRVTGAVAAILSAATETEVPMAYRGCIAVGEFRIADRFIIGPAVDEAASLSEIADAAIVWVSPATQVAAKRIHEVGCMMPILIPDYRVPLRDGRTVIAHAVSPLAMCFNEQTISSTCNTILGTFDRSPPTLDVLVKKQNTATFLRTCLKGPTAK
jgi:hypothetical protein